MIRCIAIDDEPIALDIIDRYCTRYGGITLETFTSSNAAISRIALTKPDIVFLDIELGGVSGIEIARRLPPNTCIIFTTAYAHYAIDGFEVDAVDFLHKPFFYDRFARAMNKAEQWNQMHDLLRLSESADRQIIIKSDYRNISIAIYNILYIEAVDNYIKLHLADGSTVLSKISLRAIQQMLPKDMFIRIHRSFIVARNRISSFTRTTVTINNTSLQLPIGRKFTDQILMLMNKSQQE